MMNNRNIFIFLTALLMSTVTIAQKNTPADYLHVPGPVVFDNKAYDLSWSSHPAADFYKHEYLVKGDDADKFHTMIIMDVVTGEAIKNVVSAKVAELKKIKESNPVVSYEVIANPKTGEYMLDFLLTANAPDGTPGIAERNVYRYRSFTDKAGHTGVILFGVSNRVYGPDITRFFTSLKLNRKDLMDKVALAKIPAVII